MQGLMLHCGAHHREMSEIRNIVTPEPSYSEGGRIHVPIPHHQLYDMVRSEIEHSTPFKVATEAHGVTDDGQRYFGLMEIVNGHNADDHGLVVGLRNSHDKSFAGGLVVGSRVFVCDNLSFSGEIKMVRKHTKNIMADLPPLVCESVARIGCNVEFQAKRFEAYKSTEISDEQANDLFMRAWKVDGVISSRTAGLAWDEWTNPSHDEFSPRTLWSWFNANTEVFKGNKGGRIFRGIDRETLNLHSFTDRVCGLESWEDFQKRAGFETDPDEETLEVEAVLVN